MYVLGAHLGNSTHLTDKRECLRYTTVQLLTLIGLLNLINSSEALEHFQRERGQDPLAPKYGHVKITPRNAYDRLGPGVICAVALLVPFWVGGSAAWPGSQTHRWSDREGMNGVLLAF